MTDKITIRLVVGVLGLVAILTVAGGFWITVVDKPIPDALIAIGSTAVGAVAALLARTSTGGDAPTTTGAPVHTTDGDPALTTYAIGIEDDGHALTDDELAAIGAVEEEGAP